MPFQDGAKSKGVQPIIGALLGVRRPTSDGKFIRDWLPLFAQDESGYNNLCRLVSMAHLDRPEDLDAHVTLEQLAPFSDGLIALTGGAEGAVTQLLGDGQNNAAGEYLSRLQALFPDRLYIELSRRNDSREETAEEALIDLAYARDIPLVATNPAFFAEPDFFDAHDAMLCISDGEYVESQDRRRSSRDTWIKTGKQMGALFADVPEALANTLVIAQRCVALPQGDL